MKKTMFITFLAVILAACAPATTPAPTETSIPTFTPVPPTTTLTLEITLIPATVMPTQPPIPIFTPDAIQVERWKEYEDSLAAALFPSSFIPGQFLCEWEVLGRSDQEVYVWTVCMSIFSIEGVGVPYEGDTPAVIRIETNGIVQSVEIPGGGTSYASDIRRIFPLYVQERYFGGVIHFQELIDHLRWRREHPEELPLIVLSATPAP